jgi:hypothetical protein
VVKWGQIRTPAKWSASHNNANGSKIMGNQDFISGLEVVESLPKWAQRNDDVVELCKSDLSFRCSVFAANTRQMRTLLQREAKRVMNYRLGRKS